MKKLHPIQANAILGVRLLAISMVAVAIFLWVQTALVESFIIRQLPSPDESAPREEPQILRTGEGVLQAAALLGAAGIFIFVLSHPAGHWLSRDILTTDPHSDA